MVKEGTGITHTPRSLEKMSKKKRLLPVERVLADGSCSAAITGENTVSSWVKTQLLACCSWRSFETAMVGRTFLVGSSTERRGCDCVDVDTSLGARFADCCTAKTVSECMHKIDETWRWIAEKIKKMNMNHRMQNT